MSTELLILLFFAFTAGFIDAIAGGGGLIQLPAFFLAFPALPAPVILGSNKFAALSGTLVAVVRYLRNTKVPWNAVWPAIITAVIFSLGGAQLVSLFDKETIKPVVLVLLIAVAVYTFVRKDLGSEPRAALAPGRIIPYALLTGAILGLYDGFFGPGTGTFLIVIYVALFGFDFMHASVSAKLVNCATNAAALAYFIYTGQIRYDLAIPVAICNMAGSYLGARLAIKKGSRFIRILFIIVVTGMIVRFGYDLFVK